MGRCLLSGLLAIGVWISLSPVCQADSSVTYEGGAIDQVPVEIDLTADWQFYRLDQSEYYEYFVPGKTKVPAWESVRLPHTAHLEPKVVNRLWQGEVLYKRAIFAPENWRDSAVWIRFEAAMMVAAIFLNGEMIDYHRGGYLPFTVDLSDHLRFGETNELLVHLDNRHNPVTGPKPLEILDMTMYSGLYREAKLFVRDSLHITDEMLADEVGGGGVFVHYPKVSGELATVGVKTHVQNTGETLRSFDLLQELYRDDQLIVSSLERARTLDPGADRHFDQDLDVLEPALWSPDEPNLYLLVTKVLEGGRVVDVRETRIGIRSVEITPAGVFINGKTRFLRGVNRHQEYPYVGYALSPNAHYRDAKLIKEAGFDYVRLSHYPQSPHFMRAADELGIVLLTSILGWQFYNNDPAFSEHVIQTCRDLVRRDRNHPSVIAWECGLNETEMPLTLIEGLHTAFHEEYPYPGGYTASWTPEVYDIFLQARQHRLPDVEDNEDGDWSKSDVTGKPYIVTEYGDWEYYAQNAGLNQDSWANLKEEERSSRQLLRHGEIRLLQQATNVQEAHNDNFTTPAIADGYWVMFDYNRGYSDDLEASGLASIERIPKPAYYFFRSQRDAQESSALYEAGPMVHIANEWRKGSPRDVRIYSNGDQVELFVNGASAGLRNPDNDRISNNLGHPPFTFENMEFEPGELMAVAYLGGSEVARHIVRTPGSIAAIETSLATQGVEPVKDDLIFVHARLVDEYGTTVPVTDELVELQAGEGLSIVGEGQSLSENGWAAFLVRVLDPLKSLTVTASIVDKGRE
jgi:beta-galactosidase